jgi:integrase
MLRYRSHLESRQLAPGTVNLRLGAVRRLACEPADCGLLSADLAAGICRVKCVKKLRVRLGNWLTAEQGQALWQDTRSSTTERKTRRSLARTAARVRLEAHEAVALRLDHLLRREEHWAIVDLIGKGGHVRTVPVPDWVRTELDDWLAAARLCHASGGELEQIQFLVGARFGAKRPNATLGCKQRIRSAVNDHVGIEPNP